MDAYDQRIPQLKQPKPKRKGNRKLITLLTLFFLALLAVLFFRSPYSKVEEIVVYGNTLYTKEQIVAASGLSVGMQFLNVWESRVHENMRRLKGVESVLVTRDFPGLIKLEVQEYDRVAYFLSLEDGTKVFPLLENGYVLNDTAMKQLAVDRPLIRSWKDPDLLPALAKALAQLSPAVLAQISDISLTPTPYDNQRITLYMRDGNEVRSVIHQVGRKLAWYPSIVNEIPKGEKGIIYLLESAWFSKYSNSETEDVAPSEEKKESAEDESA
ncbi:FtsQ-type POTRA domain-containing protein [Brevibacillus humidisoli]|uniref:cell division protein FtsQ/DivIB n=1 Tax=Brevibacillus humidisoli TaxID=2895522 RepID=UPI001E5BDB33|nr:FtsQ-type POTRA domain-containing protein [Brevibacillus humidisoli]UFJ41927.1 FtsQ-type POTRA domain-containing protein [Brevibacillus humidisoli]